MLSIIGLAIFTFTLSKHQPHEARVGSTGTNAASGAKQKVPPDAVTHSVAPQPGAMAHLATNSTSELFKTILDPQTGRYVASGTARESVVCKDNTGHLLWSNNVIAYVSGTPTLYGNWAISSIELVNTNVLVHAGNVFMLLDGRDGGLLNIGAR